MQPHGNTLYMDRIFTGIPPNIFRRFINPLRQDFSKPFTGNKFIYQRGRRIGSVCSFVSSPRS